MLWIRQRSFRLLMVSIIAIASVLLGISVVAKQPDHVSILMPAPFADSTAELVKSFNQQHQGRIHLNVIRGPLETEAISDLAISSLLLGDTPFDGLLMDVTWVPKYAKAGWLESLDSYFTNDEVNALATGASEGNHYQGSLLRWPLTADIGLLYWRTDLMDQPPQTPEDLESISKSLQSSGKIPYGYVWQGRQYEGLSCVFLEIIDGFGGEWFAPETGKIGLDQPPGVAAAQWLDDLIKQGISPRAVTNFAEPEALQSFKSGQAAFMRNWPYAWAELQKKDSPVRNKVGITTMVAQTGHQPASTLGSWGLSLLKGSANPESTIEAFKFLTSEESQHYLYTKYGYTPTQRAIFNDQNLLKKNPSLQSIGEALQYARSRPETPLYAQISDVLQRKLSATLTGMTAPPVGMQQAERSTSQVLEASGAAP
ncbi:ABC transporter substrate-binding protein [Synechococcus sp. UW179A]|uniref:ABC transporter substrate-binding protein n=1 Tax=Synechococcus sp. UW179A TaxID=2575510 RepID=UPI00148347D2|nr:ABC transporter substrate-binding protein [Synechococcus sp. UW179A]